MSLPNLRAMNDHTDRLVLSLILILPILLIDTLPDVGRCCRSKRVSDLCTRTLCDPIRPPNDFEVYDIFEQRYDCGGHLAAVADCLADGRDHLHCCRKTANDVDENACFELCRGTAPVLNLSHWETTKPYQTCLSVNVESIYECFRDGYRNSPGPPQRLQVRKVTVNSVDFDWDRPIEGAQRTHSYTLFYRRNGADVRKVEVSVMRVHVGNLQPNTNYSVYVVANGDEDGRWKSLPSKTVHFVTKGMAPKMVAYDDIVQAPLGAETTTLVCQVVRVGETAGQLNIMWSRMDGDRFRLLEGRQKYGYVAYGPDRGHYVATLLIRSVDHSDYGQYRCIASNQFGAGSAQVQLTRPMAPTELPESPPNITACCVNSRVKSACLPVCAATIPNKKKRGLRLDSMFPSQFCSSEFPKIMHCSMEGVDQTGCCLRRKVPLECVGICDGRRRTSVDVAVGCINHTVEIFSCMIEEARQRPEAVVRIGSMRRSSTSATVWWTASKQADEYQVYFRRTDGNRVWRRKLTVGTEVQLDELTERRDYQMVVVASNGFGRSGASRVHRLNERSHSEWPDDLEWTNKATGLLEQGVEQNV